MQLVKDLWGSGSYFISWLDAAGTSLGRARNFQIDDPTAPQKPAYPNPPGAIPAEPERPREAAAEGAGHDARLREIAKATGNGDSIPLAVVSYLFADLDARVARERRDADERERRMVREHQERLAQFQADAMRSIEIERERTKYALAAQAQAAQQSPAAGVAELARELRELREDLEDGDHRVSTGGALDYLAPVLKQAAPHLPELLGAFGDFVRSKANGGGGVGGLPHAS